MPLASRVSVTFDHPLFHPLPLLNEPNVMKELFFLKLDKDWEGSRSVNASSIIDLS